MNKDEILQTALNLVTGDRRETHGDAKENLTHLAGLWKAYTGYEFTAEQVAICMVLDKISRTVMGKFNIDDYVDMCGYASIAGEIAGPKRLPNSEAEDLRPPIAQEAFNTAPLRDNFEEVFSELEMERRINPITKTFMEIGAFEGTTGTVTFNCTSCKWKNVVKDDSAVFKTKTAKEFRCGNCGKRHVEYYG